MTSRPSGGEGGVAVFEATYKTTTRYSSPFPSTSEDCEFMFRVLIKSDSTPFYQLVDQYQMAL